MLLIHLFCPRCVITAATPAERESMRQMLQSRERTPQESPRAVSSRPPSVRGDSRPTSVRGDSRPTSVRGDSRPTSVRGDSRPTSVRGDSRPTSARGDTNEDPEVNRPSSHNSSLVGSRRQSRGKWQTSEMDRDEAVCALRSARHDGIHDAEAGTGEGDDPEGQYDEYGGYYDENNYYHDAHGNCYDQDGNYFDVDGNFFEVANTRENIGVPDNGEQLYDSIYDDYDEQ